MSARHQFVEPPQTWTACVLPHQHDPDRPRTATRGFLCEGHYLGLERNLAELPHFADEVEQALVRYSNGLNPKVSGTSQHPLPYATDSNGNSRPAEAIRLTRDLLASWTRMVLEEHPDQLHTPHLALSALCAFLTTHLEWIAAQPWIDDLHRELGDARHALRRAQRTAHTRIVALGTCGEALSCDVETHAETCCEGTLRAFVNMADENADIKPIVCTACGAEHQPETWRPLARRLRKDEAWLTAAQISELLRVPIGTVWRWASEDEWRRVDRRPKRYHHEDAQRSYEIRRVQEEAS